MTQRLGIFGGTFNPVHLGHLKTAKLAFDYLKLDKIHFVPSFHPVHKSVDIASFAHRLAMLKLSLKDKPWATINLSEFKRQGKSYTFDTLLEFNKQYPKSELYLIIGADSWRNFSSWYRFKEIESYCKIAVLPRDCEPTKIADFNFKPIYLPIKNYPISSTEIRYKIATNLITTSYLPTPVSHYILQNNLYL